MKILNIILLLCLSIPCVYAGQKGAGKVEQRIFIYGGSFEPKFVAYVKDITGKPDPRICFLPTASADNADNIRYWEHICGELGIYPHVLKVWVESDAQNQSFEEILLNMDAIVVGGGNTLNMLGIWKYQGIDDILKKALDKGIVLSGGSAGSICWFRNSISDSRPVNISVVSGYNFLPYSHCPHYDVPAKKTLYDSLVVNGRLQAGYACDEHSGILFINGKATETVSSNHQARSYYISEHKGKLNTVEMPSRVLLRKGALDTTAYRKEVIQKEVNEFTNTPPSMQTPLSSFVTIQKLFAEGRYSEYHQYAASSIIDKVKDLKDRNTEASKLSVKIIASLTSGDFAAIVSKGKAPYYSVWYFVCEDGKWKCRGEDIGGASVADAEMTFREKAPVMNEKYPD